MTSPRSSTADAAAGAGAGRRDQPQPPPRGRPRSGSRTSTCRGARAPTSTAPLGGEAWEPEQSKLSDVARTVADREPAHRGQPAQLPPRDRHAVRPRRRLGHLGAPLDRRGGPARHRHPRLPADDPGGRPGRAGAGPDDPHGGRLRQRATATHDRTRHRLRLVPGARHPGLAPQHRPHQRRPDLRPAAGPGRRGREPAHGLLPQPARAPRSSWRPNAAMRAVCDVVKTFQMPGHGIENFGRKSVQIAMAGIYDLRIHHDEVVMPVLRQLRALERDRPVRRGRARRATSWPTFLAELDRVGDAVHRAAGEPQCPPAPAACPTSPAVTASSGWPRPWAGTAGR